MDPKVAPGQKQFFYPWPYTEGLTMAEATQRARLHRHRHVRQADAEAGRRAAAARGAVEIRLQIGQVDRPLRVHRQAPGPFWEELQASEYGFWANVNPAGAASALEPGDASACSAPTSACRP